MDDINNEKEAVKTTGLAVTVPDAGRMESLGRLAAGLAHDINNVLGVIEGYATLAQDGLKAGDPAREDMGEIRKAVRSASELTGQMLLFSRRARFKREKCAAAVLLEKAVSCVPAGAKIGLKLQVQPGLPEIIGDFAQLKTAFLNLIANACEAMPDGGTLTASADLARLEAGEVRCPVPLEAGTEFIRISVSDTGRGMEFPVLERAFEPYFTTREKGKGKGLGLSFVYGAARSHNGWVEAKSEPGRGSEFSVFLPVNK